MAKGWSHPIAYIIVALGVVAAGTAALVPFYTVGYRVDAIILTTVLTPFVLYGIFVPTLRGPWALATGVVLLGLTLFLVVSERFLHRHDYGEPTLYWLLLVTVVIVLPVAYFFGKRPPYG